MTISWEFLVKYSLISIKIVCTHLRGHHFEVLDDFSTNINARKQENVMKIVLRMLRLKMPQKINKR